MSAPSPAFLAWANRANLRRAVTVDCTVYRRSDGQPLNLGLTMSHPPRGTWDNQRNWQKCITKAPTVTHQAQQAFNGRSLAAFGNLELALDDRAKLGPLGDLDWPAALNDYRWSGGQVLMRVGGPDLAWADWGTALIGSLGRPSQEALKASLPVLGRAAALQTIKVPPDTYAEAEGVPSSTVDKVKPLCMGPCNNLTPVLVSESPYTYQVHAYGPIQAISQVRVDGLAVSPASLDLAGGKFTLAAKPSGQVTCDVQGWVYEGVYLQSAPQMIEALLRRFGQADETCLDAAAFAAQHAALPAPLAVYMTSAVDIRSDLDGLCLGLPLIWMDDRLGVYTLRGFGPPSGQPVLEVYDGTAGDPPHGSVRCWNVKREPAPRWWSKCTVHGDRNWTRDASPPASLSADRQAWLKEEYRSRVATGDAPSGNPQVSEGEYKTYLASLADCLAQAQREILCNGVERDLVSFDSLYAALVLEPGDLVRVVSKVGGLRAGWLGLVVERKLDLPGRATVKLWG